MLLAMKLTLTKHVCLMKKSLHKIGMLAVAALAFAGCNRETEIKQDVTGTHVVTVQVTKDFDTRTAIVEGATEASYVWTEGDEAYFHIYENDVAATSVSMTLDTDGLATFTASFPNSNAESYEYTARYFDEESSNHNPLIKANQKPTLTSFDPSADVLIAAPQTKNAAATQLQFALKRLVSVNKMTLKGLTPGEKIKSVELASTDKNFSANYVLSSESYSAAGKKLTFDYSELATAVVDNEGTFPVYFVSAPVEDATFSVKVTTDQNVYLRDNFTSKLTFTVSQVKRFGIQLGDYGTPISTGTTYTLVESADQLCDGAVYIIVGSNATGDEFKAVGAQGKNNRAAEEVTVETDGSIILDNTTNVHSFTLGDTEDGYTLLDNDATSGYLYAAGEAATKQNYLRSSVTLIDNAYWNITFSGSELSIVSVNNDKTPYMQYNSTNSLFSCYNTESQAPVYLYVDETTCTPTPRIIVTPASIEDVDYKGGSFNDLNYELKNLEGESATITFDGEVVVNAMADPEMAGRITYHVSPNGSEEDREGWIKISAGTVEKKVLVSQIAAPSHEIHILDSESNDITEDILANGLFVGPNEGDDATFTILSSYAWTARVNFDGDVDNAFEIDPISGNGDGEESNLTEVTLLSLVAYDGDEPRYLGDIEVENGGDNQPVVISVFQNPPVGYAFETIAELNTLLTTTFTEYTGYLTDAIVSFAPAQNNAFVTDGTGSVMFYKSTNDGGHGLKQGQTYTGEITVTAGIYTSTSNNVVYNLYSEVTAWNATFSGAGTTVDPEIVAFSDLVGHYSQYQNAYVSVAGLTVVSASTSNNKTTVNVTDGTNTYVVYDNTGTTTCGAGDVITAIGTVTKYRDTEQIKVWNSGDIIVTGTAPKAITFSHPTQAGCSIKVIVDGSEITSGTTVPSGKTVTLEATAGGDFTFGGWTVIGAEVADATAAETSFVMGKSAVTVSASFTGNASTATLTVSSINSAHAMGTGSYGDYKDKNVAITIDGLNLTATYICANSKDGTKKLAASQFIQMKSESSYIYNTSGSVSSVKIWVLPSTASGLVIKSGVSQNPSAPLTNPTPTTENVTLKDNNNSNVSTSLSVYEFTSTGSYISIAPTATLWVYKVEIVYN